MTTHGPRSIRFDGSRRLILGSVDEVANVAKPTGPFAVLLATRSESPTPAERSVIETFAHANCSEMCFSGVAAERMHDIADEVIEQRGLLDITTSWLANEGPDEVAFYFVECAGLAPILFAAVAHDPALRTALEETVRGRET